MDIETSRDGSTLVAKPAGRMEGTTATELKDMIDEVLEEDDTGILIDLTDLAYMSSAGLRTIARIQNDMKNIHRKPMALCSMSTAVKAVLTTSGFNQWIIMRDSPKDALDAMELLHQEWTADSKAVRK